MRKRLLSILLLCCMVLTLLPTTALAEEAAPAFDLATDLADITIPNNLVTCVCTKANETKQYGQLTNGFSATKVAKEGNVWTVLISVKPDVYMAQFNKDTGSTHSPDGDHSNDFTTPIQFKLKYEKNKWVLDGEMPKDKTLHFTCNGGHATQNPPVFDLTKDLAGITIPADLVTCVCTKANETKQYGQLTDGFSASKVAKEGNVWTVIISVEKSVYKAQFDKDTGSAHNPDMTYAADFTNPIQFKLKYEGAKWVLDGEMPKDKTLHFTCNGGHATQNPPVFDLTKDLAGITIPADLVTCVCTKANETKQYGQLTDGFSASKVAKEGNVWTVIISVEKSVYKAQFDKDTGSAHNPDMTYAADFTNPIQFKLKYEGTEWVLDGEMPKDKTLHFTCTGQHETPEMPMYPMADNISGLGDQIVAVLCNNVPTGQQSGKYYGLIGGGFTSTAPTLNADKVYESTITLIPSAYCNQFSGDTGIMHKVLPTQTTDGLKFVVKYDSSTKMWKPAEEVKQMAIWVTCDKHETPTPEMPMYPMTDNISGLGDQIVAVLCNNVPTGQQSGKYYGLIGGGFTSTAPTLNADKVYESTITLIPSAYCNQFSGDTGIMHKVLPTQTTDGLKFVVKYDSSTKMWKPAEEVKQMAIWVTCDKHETDTPVPTEFTITFNGNGGTPSATSMTTIDQKLPELPTATHSGRYSFDGWYTAASGGTKITTATVFYENTTVYAHWTYIGGGGSSGGGGGYTYHTIRAISGLNGSISPSGWTSVRHGWDQTFTITPDKGYAVAKVLVDGKSVGSVKSYTFKNVTTDHTIEVVFMKANGNPQTGVFVDVPEGSYYEEAVDWAVEKGITTGTGNNYFTPDGICTRAQAVTFLWRVAGSPTPKTEAMVFEDVLDGSYYYEAVLWAVENGITVGTSATTFSPELTCSRAHIVTFLWRAANSPSAKTANPLPM